MLDPSFLVAAVSDVLGLLCLVLIVKVARVKPVETKVLQEMKVPKDIEKRFGDFDEAFDSMQKQIDELYSPKSPSDPVESASLALSLERIQIQIAELEKTSKLMEQELLIPYLKYKQKKKVPDAPAAPPVPSAMRGK